MVVRKNSHFSREYFYTFNSELIFIFLLLLLYLQKKRKYSSTSGAQESYKGCLFVHQILWKRVLNQQVIFPSCLDQVSSEVSLELLINFAKKRLLNIF